MRAVGYMHTHTHLFFFLYSLSLLRGKTDTKHTHQMYIYMYGGCRLYGNTNVRIFVCAYLESFAREGDCKTCALDPVAAR